jgi:prepilin-type N-terminal cleavage/methylation domain-containing protein
MKKAFTMLELVFVIIVVGILSTILIPHTKINPVQECAVDLLSQIRYTQHLATIDDKYNNSITWFKNRWQIRFDGNKYTIVSDNNTKVAQNPSNNNSTFTNVDLNAKYGITLTVTGTECSATSGSGIHIISFDHIGRPIVGDLNTATRAYSGANFQLVQSNDCDIVVSNGDESATINIAPETGYAQVTYD